MRLPLFLGLLVAPWIGSCLQPRDYDLYDYYVLHLEASRSPQDVAKHLGLDYDGPFGTLDNHHFFRTVRGANDIVRDVVRAHKASKLKRSPGEYGNSLLDGILLHQKQKLKPPLEKRGPIYPHLNFPPTQELRAEPANDPSERLLAKKIKKVANEFSINDPSFKEQWHLFNPQQKGHDLNVTGVWRQGITGKNTTVCIVDDGLDADSEDLKDNYYPEGSYDFNDKTKDPRPKLDDDRHGTRCAGEVSAAKNNVCGVGVAWDSKIAGVRILGKAISDADEALALNYGFEKTQIYSCSWGPPDNGEEMGRPGILIRRAMLNAIQKGRDGLGTIYVFAAGNGAFNGDNCNFDGYTNSIYSITVGAIDRKGLHPYYSERCSAQLVVTYSSGSGDAITTTDVGKSECYNDHGGTSAAGPLAAGVFALVLQVRPDLTWRDLQWLTIKTAAPVDRKSDWQKTALGKRFSHQFGYGKLDAYAIVEAAKDFKLVKPQAWYFSPWQHVRHNIPQGKKGLSTKFTVTKQMLQKANLETVEHVTVTMNVEHTRRGDISVDLKSPSGVVSKLSVIRNNDNKEAGYVDWTFMSVAHWGETGVGAWELVVKDTMVNEARGKLVDWKLHLFGECINPKEQGILPLPTDHDDDDHDREDATVTTTAVDVPTETAPPPGNPTDHKHRPINHKPSSKVPPHKHPEATTSLQPPSHQSGSPHPGGKPGKTDSGQSAGQSDSEHLLPYPFPHFGVSKKTQIWIYSAAVLIAIFCVSLGIYFWLAARKRKKALARENYEFEKLDGGGRTRAGELYDAFAGESDGEQFSDDEDENEPYQDEK